MTPSPHTWLASPDEAATVARLMLAFRDHVVEGADTSAAASSTHWPTDAEMRAGVERLLADPNTEYLLAAPEPGAPAVGVTQLRYRWSVWRAGEDCLLEDLFVRAEARGTGLGRALLAAAIERARARGAKRIELDTAERNEPAVRLYTSLGFRYDAYEGGNAIFLRLWL